ncbi:MAG TPA: signal recognition particle-docking protein FtsY [Candidatus Nanoarchaeia archaeon]|nr:signal recognition particle-docking protein FtsY [Candidatus Nanoarchaeia archaeon]
MFKFLKEKLKGAISKISEGVEKEGKVEETIVERAAEENPKEGKGFFSKLKEKFTGKEETKKAEEPNSGKIIAEAKKAEEKKHEPAQAKKEEPVFEKPKLEHHEPKHKEEVKLKEEIKEHKKETHHIKEEPKKEFRHEIKKHEETLEKKEIMEYKHETKAEQEISLKKPKFEVEEKKEIEVREEARALEEPINEQTPQLKTETKTEIKKESIQEPEKKGFFQTIKEKIITTKINEEQFQNLFWELELALMENNVAVEVIDKIKNDLKLQLVEKPIRRTKVEETIEETLKDSIKSLFQNSDFNLIDEIKQKKEKPYVIAFIGINGSGKTTSIAKLANLLKENGFSCVLAASDTFRAASIEQLQLHADKLNIKMIKHDYGSDPAAVAFDAIKHAKAKNIDVVLIDTAGRMHSNSNLIDEMKKIMRVAKPDIKIFVGESITGNDCVEQARTFNEAVGIDGIILSKADIDEKGGAAISVSYVTKKPILYLGMGQEYKDLEIFSKERIIKNIGLE